jgi:hypothetical protein
MSLTKERVIFDEDDLESSDLIGSRLLGTDNKKITSSTYGLKEGVDVNILDNIKNQILASADRNQEIIYEDFGTKNQRVVEIRYTSSTFPSTEAVKSFTYTLVGNRYRRDNIIWSIV